MRKHHHTRQPAYKGLRLWVSYHGCKAVMLTGWWSKRKASADAKLLAGRGLLVQIRAGRKLLRQVRPTTAASSRAALLRLAA